MPLGFLLPCIWKKYESIWKSLLLGFSFSLFIELSQLLNRRITDIDDLLINTLGTLIGWFIFRLLKNQLLKLQKKILVRSSNIEKTPFILQGEVFVYISSAFAGIFFVFDQYKMLIYPFLRTMYM